MGFCSELPLLQSNRSSTETNNRVWDNEKNSEEIGNEINFPKMTFNLIFCIGTSDITMDRE